MLSMLIENPKNEKSAKICTDFEQKRKFHWKKIPIGKRNLNILSQKKEKKVLNVVFYIIYLPGNDGYKIFHELQYMKKEQIPFFSCIACSYIFLNTWDTNVLQLLFIVN